ncbi:MAG: MBL fold metallo-hydrolase [Lentisphaeria bacterium]|nr:MBL fold metallo-hydrolase [Lentisphaeria bacterium]
MTIQCTVLSENHALHGFAAEHGLSLLIRTDRGDLLFDTGAGTALTQNLDAAGLSLPQHAILSHGHNDHTGGIAMLAGKTVYAVPGIEKKRFSCHPGKPVRDLSMPETVQNFLPVHSFTEILPGIFATGPIPRLSGEDCGGPFYLDPEQKNADLITDEQALLLREGILIQGCCHAGIINTLEYCRKCMPQINIHTVIGGLHLLLADENRLRRTADYLKNSSVRTMFLMHCTGENAIAYLRDALPDCTIHIPAAGNTICPEDEQTPLLPHASVFS